MFIVKILDGSLEYRFFYNVFKYETLPFHLSVLEEEYSTELIGNYYSLKELLKV